jgi:hypothetical protein
MRNSGNQLIDSVRALLREAVLPELQSDIARARLRQVMATLRDVDWDEAPLALLRENALLQGLVESWGGLVPAAEAVPGYEALAARNAALRRQVAEHFAAATQWSAGVGRLRSRARRRESWGSLTRSPGYAAEPRCAIRRRATYPDRSLRSCARSG